MALIRSFISTLSFCLCTLHIAAQTIVTDSVAPPNFFTLKNKQSILGLSEIIGLNAGVWAIDRYLLKEDFARIDHKTIYTNLEKGPVWDSDLFGTNFILHPYHGSLYFNSVRSNGFSFYESIPFTLTGSMIWEFIFETERPSINDLISTTFGGVGLGEASYRLSSHIFDNSSFGIKRVFREVLGTIVSPIGGLNRIISGEAWKRSAYSTKDQTPINTTFSTGVQLLKPGMYSDYLPYMQLAVNVEYNPSMIDYEKPYDWFDLNARVNIRPDAIYINQFHLSGLLWNKNLKDTKTTVLDWGIYQHIDYLDSTGKTYQQTPYRLAQIAALGPGIHYQTRIAPDIKLDAKAFLTAVGLGACLSDYYWVVDRDYSFGSGFSTGIRFNVSDEANGFIFKFSANNYQLFTWKGYEPNRVLYQENLQMLNVQGDKGSANFTHIEAELGYQSKQGWNFSIMPAFLNRSNNYKYHPNTDYSSFELTLKMGYIL